MTAVLKLKRPRGGANPAAFKLPGLDEPEIKVGRNGDDCDVFLYVDEHPSFLSRTHAVFRHRTGVPDDMNTSVSSEEPPDMDLNGSSEIERATSYGQGTLDPDQKEIDANGVEVSQRYSQPEENARMYPPPNHAQGSVRVRRLLSRYQSNAISRNFNPKDCLENEKDTSVNQRNSVDELRNQEASSYNEGSCTDWAKSSDLVSWWEVTDTKSVNGVFVNGNRLGEGPHRIAEGDRIFFGNPQHSFFLEYEVVVYPPDSDEARYFERLAKRERERKHRKERYESTQFPSRFPDEVSLVNQIAQSNLRALNAEPSVTMKRIALSPSSKQLSESKVLNRMTAKDFLRSKELISALSVTPERTASRKQESSVDGGADIDDGAGDTEAEPGVGSIERRVCKRRRHGPIQQQDCSLLRAMGGDLWHVLLSHMELTDVFLLRAVCRDFEVLSHRYLETTRSLRWTYLWKQTELQHLLGRCPNIVEINASGCFNIMDEQVSLIAELLPNIKVLDLSGCSRISKVSMIDLAERCTKIESLRLRACKRIANKDAVEYLTKLARKCENLAHLDLRCCNLEDKALIDLLSVCTNLVSLDIGSTGFAVVSDSVLFALARHCQKLENLGVMCCRLITDAGVEAVALGCGKTLRNFTVHCCFELTDISLVHLSRLCHRLESLNVHRCLKITDFGLESLAFGCGPTLKSLDVSACKISDNALMAIAKHCRDLRVLDVRSCDDITSKSFLSIAKNCPNLEQVDLSCCRNLDDEAILALAEHCTKLDQVEFSGSGKMTTRGFDALKDALGEKAAIYC